MKKISKVLLVLSLGVVFLFCSRMGVYAASASLTGPSTVMAGDTITLNLNVSDSGKYLLEGNLSYDSSVVSLLDMSSGISGWKAENNGNAIIVRDDVLSNPLSDSATVLVLNFKVNDDVANGTELNISINDILTTDGRGENSLGTASYSIIVGASLLDNANLSYLSVSEGTLNPKFSSKSTSYSIGEVDYSVSKLDISYATEDANAKVSIRGNDLAVGENVVSVVVTAGNGETKKYEILVTRKQKLDYVASSNGSLAEISVSNGAISPEFSSDVKDYIVYLPYEYLGEEFSVTGTAADEKALGVTKGTIEALVEGVNTTSVVCKAEDGTEQSYKITVVVMPEYDGLVPDVESTETEDTETEDVGGTEIVPDKENNLSENEDIVLSDDKDEGNPAEPIAIVVIIILSCALIYVLFFLNKRTRM